MERLGLHYKKRDQKYINPNNRSIVSVSTLQELVSSSARYRCAYLSLSSGHLFLTSILSIWPRKGKERAERATARWMRDGSGMPDERNGKDRDETGSLLATLPRPRYRSSTPPMPSNRSLKRKDTRKDDDRPVGGMEGSDSGA